MIRILALILALTTSAFAQSGSTVKQSGYVTPTHAACWTTNGIVQDCGTAAIPYLTTLGTVYNGPSLCANTALPSSGAWQQICLGGTTSGGAEIYVQNYGTASARPLLLDLNGTVYQFPFSGSGAGNVVGPVTSAVGDFVCWNNTLGTLVSDCGPGPGSQRSITGAYTIGASGNDNGVTITAGGNSFYAISQSGSYANGYTVTIVNTDPMPTGSNSTGAKFVNFVNCSSTAKSGTYLWPQQSVEVTYIGGAWTPTRCPGYWLAPSGAFVINVNPTSGSDTWGVADGLSTGSRAFASISNAMYYVGDMMAGGFYSATQFTFELCASCTDPEDIHWPPHGGPINSTGRAGEVINCNGGTLAGQLQLFFGDAVVEAEICTFTNIVSISEGAELVLIGSSNTFVPVSASYNIELIQGGRVYGVGATANLAAGSGAGFIVGFGASGQAIMPAINQTGNVTFSDAVIDLQSGWVSIPSWTTNSFSTTGKSYSLTQCGVLLGSTNIPGSTGSASCTQAN